MVRLAKKIAVLALDWVSIWYGNVGPVLPVLQRSLSLLIGLVLAPKNLETAPRILERLRALSRTVGGDRLAKQRIWWRYM